MLYNFDNEPHILVKKEDDKFTIFVYYLVDLVDEDGIPYSVGRYHQFRCISGVGYTKAKEVLKSAYIVYGRLPTKFDGCDFDKFKGM